MPAGLTTHERPQILIMLRMKTPSIQPNFTILILGSDVSVFTHFSVGAVSKKIWVVHYVWNLFHKGINKRIFHYLFCVISTGLGLVLRIAKFAPTGTADWCLDVIAHSIVIYTHGLCFGRFCVKSRTFFHFVGNFFFSAGCGVFYWLIQTDVETIVQMKSLSMLLFIFIHVLMFVCLLGMLYPLPIVPITAFFLAVHDCYRFGSKRTRFGTQSNRFGIMKKTICKYMSKWNSKL